ncbi:MAG: WbqC family protein [Bacteroidales bacterium]
MHRAEKGLLSPTYLGPVQFYTKFLLYDEVLIETRENYQKQSYRNRCIIFSANGILSLTVPVTKDCQKVLTRDIRIDNTLEWQKNHWNSFESAYSASPFFEFFMDDFLPFYNRRYDFLLDFNLELQDLILGHLEIDTPVKFTKEFYKKPPPDTDDYRDVTHPKKRMKKRDPDFQPAFYYQVFQDRHGFVPNLSIIDLLFNEGANAENILKQSIPENFF